VSSTPSKAGTFAPDAAPPARRFGKYEILHRIAVGGMAEIYLAWAVGLQGFQKQVVLKRILPQFADNEDFVRMFLDEGRLAATLHHSNIVQVYDIGSVDGQYFLTMEFLHGQDARQVTKALKAREQPLPLPHALAIMIGVLAGLHYAHERVVDGQPLNIVHRDVSPQNVFVTFDGGVKLLDFGIARASSRLGETRSGTLKGKICYMSPEQCSGQWLDRRSDIFAAAIMLWELTTGRRLYSRDCDFEVIAKIKDEDAPLPSAFCSNYPPALEHIVHKGLKRSRDERYATAEEMQLDLEAFARDEKLAVSPVALSRFMRELFRERIAAWERAELARPRGGEMPMPPPRSEASITAEKSATVPPVTRSENLQAPLPRRRLRGTFAIAAGVLAGSLTTWMVAKRALVGATATGTATPAASATTASQPAAAVALPAPSPNALPAPGALQSPITSSSPTKAVEPPVELPLATKPARPSRKPTRHATKKPSKGAPWSAWDPEGMLPP
jgi:serine/threonine protein kinase